MTAGWFDPHSLEIPDHGTPRIRGAVLDSDHQCTVAWIDIDTPRKARRIAHAMREQAHYGIAGFTRSLRLLEGPGTLHIDETGELDGHVTVRDRTTRIFGRIDMHGAEAPPAGDHQGNFIMLGLPENNGFLAYRLGAELSPSEPSPEFGP